MVTTLLEKTDPVNKKFPADITPNIEQALRHVELLTGSPDTPVCLRFIDHAKVMLPANREGSIKVLWPEVIERQAAGYGVFIVVNAGGHDDASIGQVRALHVDGDNIPLPDWHVPPDFLTQRDATHWHAYWRVLDMPAADFPLAQKRLIARYGSDKTIFNLSRVMRLAGCWHTKDPANPQMYKLVEGEGCDMPALLGRSAQELAQGLPEVAAPIVEARKASNGVTIDTPEAVADARRHLIDLVKQGSVAVLETPTGSWQLCGDDTTLRVCNETLDLGVSPDKGVELMLEHWYPHCQPNDDEDFVRVKMAHALEYRANDLGCGLAGEPPRQLVDMSRFVAMDIFDAILDAPTPGVTYEPPLTAHDLACGSFPPSDYLVSGYLLRRHVNLLYGDGGTGKTLLAEHFAVAIAAGIPVFGLDAKQAPVLMVLCEDDYGDTKPRLAAICRMLGQELEALPLTTWCMPADPLLTVINDTGMAIDGPFMHPLKVELENARGGFLVLDTVSDIASLDESKRLPVNALCKRVLGGLCKEFGVTILLNAHPSKRAMEDGSNYAGSTAWNNAVRNRLNFARVNKDNRKDMQRRLTVEKANHGPDGAELALFLQPDMTLRAGAAPGQSEAEVRQAVYELVLELVNQGKSVVKSNGNGLKPADLAFEIATRHGMTVNGKQVRAHLVALEFAGRLHYRGATVHGQAGYAIGSEN